MVVKLFIKQFIPFGTNIVEFTAKNLPSGVYLYRIESGEFHQVKKMVLLK